MTFCSCLAFYINLVRTPCYVGKIYAINFFQLVMLVSLNYSSRQRFPIILEQFNARKMCLQNKILVRISEEIIFTLFYLEMNLRFRSSQIIGTNTLGEFVGCVTLWYFVCFSVLFSSGSQISFTVNSWTLKDTIQTEVLKGENKIQIQYILVYVVQNP